MKLMKPGDLVITRPALPGGRIYTSTGWVDGEVMGLVLGVIDFHVLVLINGTVMLINSSYLEVVDETR